jgi:uncharacterized protein (UPF0276 family)
MSSTACAFSGPMVRAAVAAAAIVVEAAAAVADVVAVAAVVEDRQVLEGKTALGVGYRPELALAIDRRADLAFVEILAEDYRHPRDIPQALQVLHKRGVVVLIHSISLSLGGAPQIDVQGRAGASRQEQTRRKLLHKQVKHLNDLARYFDAPFVSDHIAFVRAGDLEAGHLLPVERSEAMLGILRENIAFAKETLCVPLVLENIASTFDQPGAEMDEAIFVRLVLEQND